LQVTSAWGAPCSTSAMEWLFWGFFFFSYVIGSLLTNIIAPVSLIEGF
jgi:hypothetical protein